MTDLVPDSAETKPEGTVMIHIEELKKSFGELVVLDGITTDIKQGEVVCVIGPSGSGKSTFLRCLNKLEDITAGKVMVGDFDLTDRKVDLDKVRQHIGMVFQHFNLFPHMTVLQNVTLAPLTTKKMDKAAAEKKAMELLGQVGLAEKAHVKPATLSGARSSGWRSRGHWRWIRRSCCSTRRRVPWTRRWSATFCRYCETWPRAV